MKSIANTRSFATLLLIFCLLASPLTALAKKGEKNFKRGMQYEAAQQWERAAQEFALALAANPADVEYQLHYRRAVFNASQMYMVRGRALAEQHDYVGAYNAFRQAYGYDPVNQLATSEMERMLRLQREKEGANGEAAPASGDNSSEAKITPTAYLQGNGSAATPPKSSPLRGGAVQDPIPSGRSEQLRVINYNNVDLKTVIRSLAEQLGLNVIFDTQSFRQPRTVDVNLRDVTTAQALDFIFLQENLFFQKLSRRTILVADQTRRPQYQQLVIRTFYLSNVKPADARTLITSAIPAQQGRPQTIVIPDPDTNSITVRDTAENIRLIGELLQNIDKDRAEVVMDVNIYEVSRTDLLQFGNQLGSADTTLTNLGGIQGGFSILGGAARHVIQGTGSSAVTIPTALGTALVFPASTISALQRKDKTRLLASTQVHAFNGEESTARIGQRVPVQTAQTYPFGNFSNVQNPNAGNQGINFGGGFPVFNYEPTGLTLKFTPQVFPNLDVQVKMSIESKDVFSPGAMPTFTERTITGTARIQNNRTMLLASVAQDKSSNGRQGLPLLGLVPVLGRLFTAPRRDNSQVDIVIAVTPRVLRAPAVTPRDEEPRQSGTLMTPTSGSLEAMVQEADREEQLAAARRAPTATQAAATARPVPNNDVVVQVPGEEPPAYIPAPKALMSSSAATPSATESRAGKTLPAAISPLLSNISSAPVTFTPVPVSAPVNTLRDVPVSALASAPATQPASPVRGGLTVQVGSYNERAQAQERIAFLRSAGIEARIVEVQIPLRGTWYRVHSGRFMNRAEAMRYGEQLRAKGVGQDLMVTEFSEAQPGASESAEPLKQSKTRPVVDLMGSPRPVQDAAPYLTTLANTPVIERKVPAGNSAAAMAAELRLMSGVQEMRVGDKRRLALMLKTEAPLNVVALTLWFDPRVVAIRDLVPGNLLANASGASPNIMQSVKPGGVLGVSLTPPAGGSAISGAGVLLFVDFEAVAAGESVISFDVENTHLITADGRSVQLQPTQYSRVLVTK